ncbi:hypothetical protein SEEH1025_05472, partial [Salmonella enterica subsp. enterica serovar Heidelberg str. 670102-5]
VLQAHLDMVTAKNSDTVHDLHYRSYPALY